MCQVTTEPNAKGHRVICDGLDIFYYNQPVASDDQAVSLAQYLTRHGQQAYKNGSDEVIVPLEVLSSAAAADASAQVYTLISTWKLFWEHSDSGVFELPIYVKD